MFLLGNIRLEAEGPNFARHRQGRGKMSSNTRPAKARIPRECQQAVGEEKNQPPIGTRWRDPSTRPLRSARRKSCGTAALAQWHAIPFLPRPRPSRLSVQLCSLAPHAHVIPRPLRLTSSLPVPRPLAMADAYWRYAAAAPRQQQQQQQPPPSAGGGVAHPGMGVGAPQMAPAGGQQQPMKRPRPTEFSGPPGPCPPPPAQRGG
jgi:hypothetical protein